MRKINRIFIHCTAGSQRTYTDEKLLREFKNRGWQNPGYHYVIRPDGSIFNCFPEDKIANGVKGYNSESIHVSYVGGIDSNKKAIDNRTIQQKETMKRLLQDLKNRYPNAVILGHRDISPDTNHNGKVDAWERIKQCPCFDAMIEYAYLNK